MPIKRLGVEMSALKARIVDMVVRGGDDGVPLDEIFNAVFRERHGSRHTLKAHVWQINEMLADEGYKIVCEREHVQRGPHRRIFDRYHLARISVRSVA